MFYPSANKFMYIILIQIDLFTFCMIHLRCLSKDCGTLSVTVKTIMKHEGSICQDAVHNIAFIVV